VFSAGPRQKAGDKSEVEGVSKKVCKVWMEF